MPLQGLNQLCWVWMVLRKTSLIRRLLQSFCCIVTAHVYTDVHLVWFADIIAAKALTRG